MLSEESLEIFRGSHWVLRHSAEAAIPGYLVLFSTRRVISIGDLPPAASAELGQLLSASVKAVEAVVWPERVYVCLFNESYSCVHFHVFPRMSWMRQCTPEPDDPSNLIDGGVVFSAARRAKANPAEILAMEPQILDVVAQIRVRITGNMPVNSASRL